MEIRNRMKGGNLEIGKRNGKEWLGNGMASECLTNGVTHVLPVMGRVIFIDRMVYTKRVKRGRLL